MSCVADTKEVTIVATPKIPCYQCKNRTMACHCYCEKYSEFQAEWNERNATIRAAKEKEKFMRDYEIRHYQKRKGR